MFRPCHFLPAALLASMPQVIHANNIQVSNVSLTGKNTITDTYQI